ncbi:hypothetical protein BGZ70_006753 [Mortierella alpina]|uniref:Uncharacterized protein n=1 Tax=Mortierella alpina TaxID=64518 RepID=A0A9P6JDT0_MORAP|nr:hypothetical protein BGZ70_006753 [Mortierella alpina]
MPVNVDDPFLLASFSSTTHQHQHQPAVSCTPEGRDGLVHAEESSELLVVAIQGEGVQLYNTADQKCVLSYSTPPGYSFSGSAQTIQRSEHVRHVYSVIAKGTDVPAKEEGKVVWMWKDESSTSVTSLAMADAAMEEDTVKPTAAAKSVHKFDRQIQQLFVSPLLPKHVLLSNTDGSISLVTEDLKRVVSTKDFFTAPEVKTAKKGKKDAAAALEKTGSTIWSTTFNTTGSWISSSALAPNTLIIMTIVELTSERKTTVSLKYVNEEQRGFSTFGEVDIEAAAGASGFAFDVQSGQLSFMTAAGQLKIYNFVTSQGNYVVSATEMLTLPLLGYAISSAAPAPKASRKGSKAPVEIDAKISRVDAVALGDNYLAVAGIHQTNGKDEQTLTIWDIRYGTLQAKHVVPGTFSVQNTTCQLALLPGSVLVMTISTLHNTTIKSDVYLCPFYAEPMSLLGAMGRMKDTAPFLGQTGALVAQDAYTATTTALLAPSDIAGVVKVKGLIADGDGLEKQLKEAQTAERKALESLGSESKTSTAQEFESEFFKHVEQQTAEAVSHLMDRFGVKSDDVQTAMKAEEEKKMAVQKQAGAAQDMDVDPAPLVAPVDTNSGKKKKNKASKAAAKEVKEVKKDTKAEGKNKSKAKPKSKAAEAVMDGSSSESSSDDEEDEGEEEPEVIDLSSDDERNADNDEEQEYELNDVQERDRMEVYRNAVDEWRKTEAEAIKNYKVQRRLLRAGRKQTPLPELSHHFVSTVVGRCFSRLSNGQPDMGFWPAKVIEYLIENQLVGNSNPGAGQSGIVLELMEREQWSLVELALKKLHDIPEMDMVLMLKQVIGLNKSKASSATSGPSATASQGTPASTKASHNSTSSSSSSASASASSASSASTASPAVSTAVPDIPHFLNVIMAAPRNEIFMQQAVKRLTIEELSIVLEILKGWIGIWDERGGIGHQNQQPDKKQLPGGLPGYGLMIEFTTLLMDVHFPSLILSPHLHPVLKAIQKSIQHETEVSNQLEQTLRGPLGLFDRKHREMIRRKKEATVSGFAVSNSVQGSAAAGGAGAGADKRRRRRWEGGEGIPDYAVEIIHL